MLRDIHQSWSGLASIFIVQVASCGRASGGPLGIEAITIDRGPDMLKQLHTGESLTSAASALASAAAIAAEPDGISVPSRGRAYASSRGCGTRRRPAARRRAWKARERDDDVRLARRVRWPLDDRRAAARHRDRGARGVARRRRVARHTTSTTI